MNLGQWDNNDIIQIVDSYAVSIGLNKANFSTCMESQGYMQAIQDDIQYGRSRNVTGTPSFFVNDQFLSGAQPINAFEQIITQVLSGELVVERDEAPEIAAATVTAPPPPTPIPVSIENAAGIMGDPDAPITIIEYTDYGCPFCARHSAHPR